VTRLVIATTNPHKRREIEALLAGTPVTLAMLTDFPSVAEPEETGATFRENAYLKALYYSARLAAGTPGGDQVLVAAEDSGLVVDALDGDPGVRSARFLRPDASYAERFAEIERRLRERPERARTARFVCALAVADAGAVVFETTGTIEGEIAAVPRGDAGFGYDPIFIYPPYGRTLAEVSQEEKLRVAHRGQAFRRLAEWLRDRQVTARARDSLSTRSG
jgi:XTP/dITP diphosphohydrolase